MNLIIIIFFEALKCFHDYHYLPNDSFVYPPVIKEHKKTVQPYWISKCNISDEAMKCKIL